MTLSQAFKTQVRPYFGWSELTNARVTATALVVPGHYKTKRTRKESQPFVRRTLSYNVKMVGRRKDGYLREYD